MLQLLGIFGRLHSNANDTEPHQMSSSNKIKDKGPKLVPDEATETANCNAVSSDEEHRNAWLQLCQPLHEATGMPLSVCP